MDVENLYRQTIMDHYKHPHHKQKPPSEDFTSIRLKNPSCGDDITLHVKIDNDIIEDIYFEGEGCAISLASASMLTQELVGKSASETLDAVSKFKKMITSGIEVEQFDDAIALSGIHKFPARMKCANLAWDAMEKVINERSENE